MRRASSFALDCSPSANDGLLRGGQQPLLAGKPDQRRLQLLERADLDLPNAFAADAIDLAQILERLRLVDQPTLGQDVLLAVVEAVHRLDQQLVPNLALFIVGDDFVLERAVVDQEVLPLAFAVGVAQRGVEAGVAAHAHAAVHAR